MMSDDERTRAIEIQCPPHWSANTARLLAERLARDETPTSVTVWLHSLDESGEARHSQTIKVGLVDV